jgi:large subunit ribosomal protein L18
MSRVTDRKQVRRRIKRRYRDTVRGTGDRPRLAVYRSLRYLYAQLIDDQSGITLASASTIEKDVSGELTSTCDRKAGKRLGEMIAERAKDRGISAAVFDRGGFRYHGVVRAIADGARGAGLHF